LWCRRGFGEHTFGFSRSWMPATIFVIATAGDRAVAAAGDIKA